MEWLLYNKKHVFLSGKSGVGKSVIASDMIRSSSEKRNFETLKFIFSAQTNSNQTQMSILDNLFFLMQKKRGAKPGMTNIICVPLCRTTPYNISIVMSLPYTSVL